MGEYYVKNTEKWKIMIGFTTFYILCPFILTAVFLLTWRKVKARHTNVMKHREVSNAELEDTSPENQLDVETSQAGSLPTAVVQQLIATQQKTNELLEKLVRLDHGKTASSVRSRKKTPAGTELVDDRDAAPVGMAYSV